MCVRRVMVAVRNIAAGRKYGWPLDRSTLYTCVTKHVDPKNVLERLQSGCYVQGVLQSWPAAQRLPLTGLYLEGAAWDLENQCLVPPKPKQLVQDLPILQVIPIEVCTVDPPSVRLTVR